ncbi:Gfo/Idh/MocA family oxidoreductase [Tateyamaria omphalii]|uniref:Gfo/Idh/MocA family protein n=1 Tax=Tateyamaria omphalii TaxID=299262 RepID=UPI001C99FAAE|nr:Gfo/Idh/MocA family oxidoreductase [Tateyamaria omphalii]MBY5933705.1 Gfo/Idh/MocA family oxidoreductase [Tateyamaria omphalii]
MIRVAILGGGIGAQHLAAYDLLDGFSVTHLVDQDADRCAALCGDRITPLSTVEEALDEDVDLIDICLPPHLHTPVAIDALNAGKHVICEKPLATSIAQADAIAEAAAHTGKSVFPVFQYRFGPAFDRLRALQTAGLVGAPRAASLETHWNRDADYYAVPWRGTWAGEQGGAVLGHAIHAHDLLATFMAPIEAVTARLGTLVNLIETDDSAALIFELAGGALATSSITLGSARDETRLRLVYEHLTATSHTNPYAPGEGDWQFVARDPDRQADVDAICAGVPLEPAGFAGFLSEVGKAIAGEPNRAVTLENGVASISLVTAIYASHRNQVRISLPLPADHPMREGWQP